MLKTTSLRFILCFALAMTIINFTFLTKAFGVMVFPKDIFFAITMVIVFFSLLVVIFSVLLLPYLLKPVVIISLFISAIASYFMYNYGTIIDSEMLRNAMQTDAVETTNLITFKFVVWVLFLAILPTILIIKLKIYYAKLKFEFMFRTVFIIISLLIVGAVYASLGKTYVPFFRQNKELRFYTVPFYPIYSSIKLYKKMHAKPTVFTKIGEDATKDEDEEKNIMVFVVGETQRSSSYSLNGYTKNDTNHFLKTQKDLVSLTNFHSCGTATATSLPCMFSNLGREKFSIEKANNMSNFLDVLQKSGVNIFWFDNNSGGCKGVCDRLPKENVKIYKALGYDDVVYKDAKEAIEKANDDTLIILHVQGSHGPVYFEGYPDEFKKFKPTCDTAKLESCSLDAIQNTYDNTIFYQDYLQNDLINSLKQKDKKFEKFFVFISDHGESLGENGIYLHGMPYSIAPLNQRIVPAIFWFDDEEGGLVDRLRGMKDSEFSHDYIFHTMLGFFHIKSLVYNPNLDIFKINQWRD